MEASRRRLGPKRLVWASAVRARPVQAGRVILAAALLAVGAAGLFGPGAGPAMAVDGEPDNTARYSACVGAATDPAGFVDTADIFAEDAINCLAYYQITKGTSSGTTFSPGNSVNRWQMALFLVRAAEAAGLALPEAREQGFEDIGTLGPSTREAVNRLAQLGITRGTGEGRFSPYGPVSRQQMALFLYRFLGEIPIGEGGVEVSEVVPDDTVFEDISPLSRAVEQAIMVIYEMGITGGTSEGRFSPNDRVSRSQMALFIARALDHSNARPAGGNHPGGQVGPIVRACRGHHQPAFLGQGPGPQVGGGGPLGHLLGLPQQMEGGLRRQGELHQGGECGAHRADLPDRPAG